MGAKTLEVKASHASLRAMHSPELKKYHPITGFAWFTLSVAGGYAVRPRF